MTPAQRGCRLSCPACIRALGRLTPVLHGPKRNGPGERAIPGLEFPLFAPMTGERFVDLSGPDADISEPVG